MGQSITPDASGLHQPAEVLAMAMALENYNAQQYRAWASRFRPFHAGVSRVLAAIGSEAERRGARLRRVAEDRFGLESAEPAGLHPEAPVAAADLRLLRHFFVVDRLLARAVLEHAVALQRYTLKFYRQRLATATDASLHALLEALTQEAATFLRTLRQGYRWLDGAAAQRRPGRSIDCHACAEYTAHCW